VCSLGFPQPGINTGSTFQKDGFWLHLCCITDCCRCWPPSMHALQSPRAHLSHDTTYNSLWTISLLNPATNYQRLKLAMEKPMRPPLDCLSRLASIRPSRTPSWAQNETQAVLQECKVITNFLLFQNLHAFILKVSLLFQHFADGWSWFSDTATTFFPRFQTSPACTTLLTPLVDALPSSQIPCSVISETINQVGVLLILLIFYLSRARHLAHQLYHTVESWVL
jgi:hypothetical protein